MAQLVVAEAPYKIYPGGVIAIPCSEIMGASRGTLTTESDARSVTGTVVRDTQQVTTSIRDDIVNAIDEAEDTLVLNLQDYPWEFTPSPGTNFFRYTLFISHLIEGDWDASDATVDSLPNDTYRGSNQSVFTNACKLTRLLDVTVPSAHTDLNVQRKGLENFTLGQIGSTTAHTIPQEPDSGDVWALRAFAQDGTTVEWLLDQLIFVPFVTGSTPQGDPTVWRSTDFKYVGGGYNRFGEIDITNGDFIDGDDGGDDNGKFTWVPSSNLANQQTSVADDMGGDVQQVADYEDAEYMNRVIMDDFLQLWNSQDQIEVDAFCYTAFGAEKPAATLWVDDDLDRTAGDGTEAGSSWGPNTYEGFRWNHSPNGAGLQYASADGARGRHFVGGDIGGNASVTTTLGNHTDAAFIQVPDFDFSGKVQIDNNGQENGTGTAKVYIVCQNISSGGSFRLVFDLDADTWAFQRQGAGGSESVGWTDLMTPIAFTQGNEYGFRIRFDRYRMRARVWSTGGAEPSTWDFDGFRPLYRLVAAVLTRFDYPYSDDLDRASSVTDDVFNFQLVSEHVNNVTSTWSSYWDDIILEYDPDGNFGDVTIALEKPEDTLVDQITLPNSAQQLIYWGRMDITDLDTSGTPDISYLAFSTRAWNEVGSAALQQARTLFHYFRSSKPSAIDLTRLRFRAHQIGD